MATLMTKAEFAALCGVAKSRVSHWIKDGLISGAAIVGEGRAARLDVEQAAAQLAKRRDPGQALGNGAKTKVRPAAVSPPSASPEAPPARPAPPKAKRRPAADIDAADDELDADALDYAVQRARLARAQADGQERKNAVEMGELLPAEDVARRWSAVVLGVRAGMLAVTGRVRDALPHLAAADVAKIDAEIRRALKEASHGQFA